MSSEAIQSRMHIESDGFARDIAVADRAGNAPGVFWMSGFMSDMGGTKASEVDQWCAGRGLACTRFDYSAHGASSGTIEDGSLSRWLEESLTVFRKTADGPRIVIGSSMGGFLATLMAKALCAAGATSCIVPSATPRSRSMISKATSARRATSLRTMPTSSRRWSSASRPGMHSSSSRCGAPGAKRGNADDQRAS